MAGGDRGDAVSGINGLDLPGGLPGLSALRAQYAKGETTVPRIAERVWALCSLAEHREAWIHRVPKEELLAAARRLQTLIEANADALRGAPKVRAPAPVVSHSDPLPGFPLLGIPFAVKDNIDVAGVPTTAACPGYSRIPEVSAPAVQRLIDAGALFVGKTNMDQFATGLVGTRSPYGACKNPFDPAYISGGSSSGSAVAVSTGRVAFSLGTDTAGSGRVPAAFTNIVGLKPTRGAISTRGVVPACPSLDCVSVFAHSAADAFAVVRVLEGFDAADPYSRPRPAASLPAAASSTSPAFRFGVPLPGQLDFSGDADYAALYERSRADLRALGGVEVPVDIAPLLRAAQLLYRGPWLAERAEAIGRFADDYPDALLPLLRDILAPARDLKAIDAFKGFHELQALRRAAEPSWGTMDLLLLPTTPTIFTLAQIDADPIALNGVLGRFTNFVNLMDLCALTLPAGFRRDGLPFGFTAIAPAFQEETLARVAAAWEKRPT
jgi:allophanate hydrolase